MKKIIKSKIFLIILMLIIGCGIGVYGANTYNSNNILYTTSDGTNMSVEDALNDLYNNGFCNAFSFARVGDYVSMTPTSTSFTTDTSITGYSSTQTINPSELNLWRIIKINDDGTIEMISEYVSSVSVYFSGRIGYQNLVGYLNEIASQYKNNKYIISSRHIGYNGQTEYITDTSKLTQKYVPWSCSTGGSCNPDESLGGGDMLYEADTNLVQNVLGTLLAKKVGTTTITAYWLTSRYFAYNSSWWLFRYRYVNTSISGADAYDIWYYNGSSFGSESHGYAIRPILTLKSGLTATGSGTRSDPYVLN